LALTKAVDFKGCERHYQVPAVRERPCPPVDDVATIDGGDRFEPMVGVIRDRDLIALPLFTDDVGTVANALARQRLTVTTDDRDSEGTTRGGEVTHEAVVDMKTGKRIYSAAVVVEHLGDREGPVLVSSHERNIVNM
jgi:hypothetical protein